MDAEAKKLALLTRERDRLRERGVVMGRQRMNKSRKEVRARVISNIPRPWWGNEALTPVLNKD